MKSSAFATWANARLRRSIISLTMANGARFIVLSDRAMGPHRIPIPSLLATSAVHHHLIREGTRTRVACVELERAGSGTAAHW